MNLPRPFRRGQRGPLENAPASATMLVGPEGGWTEDEVALAIEAGCLPVSLGPRTLRADAAAIVALSVMFHVWGESEEVRSQEPEARR